MFLKKLLCSLCVRFSQYILQNPAVAIVIYFNSRIDTTAQLDFPASAILFVNNQSNFLLRLQIPNQEYQSARLPEYQGMRRCHLP